MNQKQYEKAHPLVLLLYVITMLIVTMSTINVIVLLCSFFTGLLVCICLEENKKKLVNLISLSIPIIVFMIGLQPLLYHTGSKVLFYVNESAVYMENYLYGAVISLMLVSGIIWCVILRIMIDSEKMFYLFGRLSPTLGLFFTMILRFIPLFKNRLKQIHEGQLAMGIINPSAGLLSNMKYRLREFSILVSWSLESSIETANSMESRGYGLKGRTSYHKFIMNKRDKIFIFIQIMILAFLVWELVNKKYRVYMLPVIIMNKWDIFNIAALVLFICEALLPVIIELVFYVKKKSMTKKES